MDLPMTDAEYNQAYHDWLVQEQESALWHEETIYEDQIEAEMTDEKLAWMNCVHIRQMPVDELLERVLPVLGRRFRVWAFDTPGYGASDSPPEPPEIPEYAATLLEAIDHERHGVAHDGAVEAVVEVTAVALEPAVQGAAVVAPAVGKDDAPVGERRDRIGGPHPPRVRSTRVTSAGASVTFATNAMTIANAVSRPKL